MSRNNIMLHASLWQSQSIHVKCKLPQNIMVYDTTILEYLDLRPQMWECTGCQKLFVQCHGSDGTQYFCCCEKCE